MTKADDRFVLKNDNGVEVTFIGLGGRFISMKVPSPNGEIADVILGYDTTEEALNGDIYFGAICGRYANRISKGKFDLEGISFELDVNNGPNHLHGGFDGFHNRVWEIEKIDKEGAVSAYKLSLTSPDGDQKYPGELIVTVIYSLTSDNQLCLDYEATTNKSTIINLTSHPYFNLKGAGSGNILNHELQMMASKFTTIDSGLGTCSGEILPVAATPFDFVNVKKVSEAIVLDNEQIQLGGEGLDHNFVIDDGGKEVKLAARLHDPDSGRTMEVYTDQPGIQIYTGNHFDGTQIGKTGIGMVKYAGLAMETQIFPNSPNIAHFPNAILRPGELYKHCCIYKFL
jgi:aldose 1-epimerase